MRDRGAISVLRRRFTGLFCGAALAAFAASALGQGKGKGQGNGNAQDKSVNKNAAGKPPAGPAFSSIDTLSIYAYARATPGFLTPEARGLPPGLAKNLQRGKPLPPGWQKKMVGFPPALEQRLRPLPVGYRRVVVDRWAFVIAEASNTVLDVMDLVKRPSADPRIPAR